MEEFVRIRGAQLQETMRFSKIRNKVTGQIFLIPEGSKNGFNLPRQRAQPGRNPDFHPFPGSSSPFAAPLRLHSRGYDLNQMQQFVHAMAVGQQQEGSGTV